MCALEGTNQEKHTVWRYEASELLSPKSDSAQNILHCCARFFPLPRLFGWPILLDTPECISLKPPQKKGQRSSRCKSPTQNHCGLDPVASGCHNRFGHHWFHPLPTTSPCRLTAVYLLGIEGSAKTRIGRIYGSKAKSPPCRSLCKSSRLASHKDEKLHFRRRHLS